MTTRILEYSDKKLATIEEICFGCGNTNLIYQCENDSAKLLQVFSALEKCKKIRKISLWENKLELFYDNYLIKLFQTLSKLKTLESIDISHNNLGQFPPTSFLELINAISSLPELAIIRLPKLSNLSERQLAILSEAIQEHPKLNCLDFLLEEFSSLTTQQIQAFFSGISISKITKLKFHMCELSSMGDKQFQDLIQAINFEKMNEIDLGRNYLEKLSNSSWEKLKEALSNNSMQILNLSFIELSEISDEAFENFCLIIKECTHVEKLSLNYIQLDQLSPERIRNISESLSSLENVRVLKLEHNKIGDLSEESFLQVMEALKSLPRLERLNFWDNSIGNLNEEKLRCFNDMLLNKRHSLHHIEFGLNDLYKLESLDSLFSTLSKLTYLNFLSIRRNVLEKLDNEAAIESLLCVMNECKRLTQFHNGFPQSHKAYPLLLEAFKKHPSLVEFQWTYADDNTDVNYEKSKKIELLNKYKRVSPYLFTTNEEYKLNPSIQKHKSSTIKSYTQAVNRQLSLTPAIYGILFAYMESSKEANDLQDLPIELWCKIMSYFNYSDLSDHDFVNLAYQNANEWHWKEYINDTQEKLIMEFIQVNMQAAYSDDVDHSFLDVDRPLLSC